MFPDSDAGRMVWQLAYTGLSTEDIGALNTHFVACQGRFRAFTFIDPTDNILVNSSNLAGSGWQTSSWIQLASNVPDPNGGTLAFTLSNTSGADQEIVQTVAIPAAYQYCFSVFATSPQQSVVTLSLRGTTTEQAAATSVDSRWTRAVVSGRLSDLGTSVTIGIRLSPGQQIGLFGPQLEGQIYPSRYHATSGKGGVYPNAHWGIDQLTTSSDAPSLFSTTFSIETAV